MNGALHSTPPYIPTIDSLRFVAFLLIFFHHAAPSTIPVFKTIQEFGWLGVDIFLSLSAFLLTRLLVWELGVKKHIDYVKYFIRRTLRIWPLYFAYLILIGIGQIFIESISFSLPRFITLITFTDNVAAAIDGYNPNVATGHLWTISFEEQFYLILPFALTLMDRVRKKMLKGILFGIIAAGVIARFFFLYYDAPFTSIWVLPLTHFESILAGILLAFLLEQVSNLSIISLITMVMISTVAMVLAPRDSSFINNFISYSSAGILSFSLLALAIRYSSIHAGKERTQDLTQKAFMYLGKISYGLYIFHLLSLRFIYFFDPFANQFANDVAALMLCVLLAILSFEFFEKKFLVFKKNYAAIDR